MKPPDKKLLARATPVIVVVLIALALWFTVTNKKDKPEALGISELTSALQDGKVVELEVLDRSNKVKGKFKDGTKFTATYPKEFADELAMIISDSDVHNAEVKNQSESTFDKLLYTFGPILLLIGGFVLVMNSTQGGGGKVMQFGRAKARLADKAQPDVTFKDVAGADEAIEELAEIVGFLKDPAKYEGLGAKIPKGVLLFGPPGTGKTLLARAVAGEAGVPFFSISGSDFVEMFVGVGASRVRNLFDQAKAQAPAIVFVDEIDAVGRHRGAGLGGGHDEREQTLNQLLVEMDGFDAHTGVIMIAATNRPDILDPALLRPGRFDRQITVDSPDQRGREQVLELHASRVPMAAGVDLKVLARRTPGFTGADLANLINEAALLAARANLKEIGMMQLEAAIDRVIGGPERRTRVISERERQIVAFHEAGHALVGHVLPLADPIHKISIIPRGRALGWTLALPEEDRLLVTRGELLDRLAMLLGGRTAEELVFSDPTTGAQDDIERATKIARAMVTEYGMSRTLGPQQLGQNHSEVFLGRDIGHQANYSDSVASLIDDEVRRLIDTAHSEANRIISHHRDVLERLASELISRESLEPAEISEILAKVEKWKRDRDDSLGNIVNEV